MPYERVETTRMRCHGADCGTTHYVPDGKTPPGFTGTATRTEADGSTVGPVDWYACRATHIRPAIVAVTAEPEPAAATEGDDDDDGDEDGSDENEPGNANRGDGVANALANPAAR